MYSANPIGASLLFARECRKATWNAFSGFRWHAAWAGSARWQAAESVAASAVIPRARGSVFRWTSAFGDRQSLHVRGVLKDACALQCFASRGTVGHGSCLFQRCQRLEMQVPLGPIVGLLLVHSKRLKNGTTASLFGIELWNQSSGGQRDGTLRPGGSLSSQPRAEFGGNQITGWPLPILEVSHEQRKAHR